jgi:hypothetical protein
MGELELPSAAEATSYPGTFLLGSKDPGYEVAAEERDSLSLKSAL